jgi:hypothetical protein
MVGRGIAQGFMRWRKKIHRSENVEVDVHGKKNLFMSDNKGLEHTNHP